MIFPEEIILEDDYPVYIDYVYIADGYFKRSPISATVRAWKALDNIKEIRRCELFKHGNAKLGDKA